ncbi:MAG: ECF-type sigma factor [Pirellulales bacterium]
MNSAEDGSVTHAFRQLRAGDAAAAGQLWQRYFPRLMALARQAVGNRAGPLVDAEDAVQSAFVSFWRGTQGGIFDAELNRDDLWNLLGVVTVRKALKLARREQAQKRGGGRVQNEADITPQGDRPFSLDEALGRVPVPEFDLICQELLLALPEDLRPFALLRLMGYKDREVAETLQCTQRKVERKLHLVRLTWERASST